MKPFSFSIQRVVNGETFPVHAGGGLRFCLSVVHYRHARTAEGSGGGVGGRKHVATFADISFKSYPDEPLNFKNLLPIVLNHQYVKMTILLLISNCAIKTGVSKKITFSYSAGEICSLLAGVHGHPAMVPYT